MTAVPAVAGVITGTAAGRLTGTPAADTIRARDDRRETIRCGSGRRDTVTADRGDRVARDCETVRGG